MGETIGSEDEFLELGVNLKVLAHFGPASIVNAVVLETQEDDGLVVLEGLGDVAGPVEMDL